MSTIKVNRIENTATTDGGIDIDSNGKIGVGTASPTFAAGGGIHNKGSNGAFTSFRASVNSNTGIDFAASNDGTGYVYNRDNADLIVGTNNAERLRIKSDGKLGVGTSSPSDLLSLSGSGTILGSASGPVISLADASNRTLKIAGPGAVTNAVIGTTTNHELQFITANTVRATVNTSGNLGIGTTSPQSLLSVKVSASRQLDVIKDSGDDHLVLKSTAPDASYNLRAIELSGERVAFSTGASSGTSYSERLRIDSSGNVGIGVIPNTHNIGKALEIGAEGNVVWGEGAGNIHLISNAYYNGGYKYATSAPAGRYNIYQNTHSWSRAASGSADAAATFLESMRIDSSGRLLVGQTATPGGSGQYSKIFVAGYAGGSPGGASISIARDESVTSMSSGDGIGALQFTDQNGYMFASVNAHADATPGNNDFPGRLSFRTTPDGSNTAQERMRIDSSGRLLVGTTNTYDGEASNLVVASSGHTGITVASTGANQRTNLYFADGTSGPAAYVGGFTYNHNNNSLLTRTNGLDRTRIDSSGNFLVGKSDLSDTTAGLTMRVGGVTAFEATVASGNNHCMMLNRQSDDGTLIAFRQANYIEGSITVSGSTVSYNGGHLARWSQLPGGVSRTEILRGSVLSNLDEMCEWGGEDNEQLNRMKISDVEGDANVSGVFQAWDDNDDTYVNDFYCAMTGDFVIRIAQGTTVARGDLLMSAGDGTAKPQDDDIVRSKTIAKVTSTTVSTTYSDNSYCVPCVLMAC